MEAPGVYRIRNTETGGVYVGSTGRSVRRRLWEHRRKLELGKHVNRRLQSAWDKYGSAVFVFEPLVFTDAETARWLEQHLLDALVGQRHVYNLAKDAVGAMKGRKHSAATRAKISAAKTGRRLSEEHRRNIGLSGKGLKRSEETRDRIRQARLSKGSSGAKFKEAQASLTF